MAVMGLLVLLLTGNACRKTSFDGQPAVLQIVNAMDNGTELYANFSTIRPGMFSSALYLHHNFSHVVGLNQFPQPIQFYIVQDTLPENEPVINSSIDVKPGETYSLFIYGQKSSTAYSLVQDQFLPINRKDTFTYIRFANFSESQSISVNLKGAANGSYIQNLPFKSVTEFMPVQRNTSMPDPEFEIRDQATGELIASQLLNEFNQLVDPDWNAPYEWFFRFNTFVLTGQKGGVAPNDQQVFKMQHR